LDNPVTARRLGCWYDIEISGVGNELRLLVDGEIEWQYTDNNLLNGGSFAFETLDDSIAHIDEIRVTGQLLNTSIAWVRTGGPLGGLGYDVRMRPDNPQIVYAATGTSGLLKSSNGGSSWTQIQIDVPASVPVLSVAINPSNTNIIFAGFAHRGLYRSDDSGTIWHLSMEGMVPEARVSDIIFDPKNPQVLYAADSLSGVYQSTDSGRSWRQINSALRTRAVNRLVISADGIHLYAATEGEGVYRLDIDGNPPQP